MWRLCRQAVCWEWRVGGARRHPSGVLTMAMNVRGMSLHSERHFCAVVVRRACGWQVDGGLSCGGKLVVAREWSMGGGSLRENSSWRHWPRGAPSDAAGPGHLAAAAAVPHAPGPAAGNRTGGQVMVRCGGECCAGACPVGTSCRVRPVRRWRAAAFTCARAALDPEARRRQRGMLAWF
jgi:hypothetical protein